MPAKEQAQRSKRSISEHQTPTAQNVEHDQQAAIGVQKARTAPQLLRTVDVLQLQRAIGNRAVGQLLAARGSTKSENGSTSPIVQRVIQLNGIEVDIDDLVGKTSDQAEKDILRRWHSSLTVHNFKGSSLSSARRRALSGASNAKNKAALPPSLYSAANLKFLTKDEGRLPTLYFKSGNTSGRIRQQHSDGPKISSEANKTDYFFQYKERMKAFSDAAKQAKRDGTDFDPDLEASYAYLFPKDNDYHCEVTSGGGKKVSKVHPSGGKIDLDISAYNDLEILSIYQQAIGSV